MSNGSVDILLVEDDRRLADLTAEYFQQNGLSVAVESRFTSRHIHDQVTDGERSGPALGSGLRVTGDAADLAAIVRGEKESEWGMEHDLAVQESVLLASNLPIT